MKTLFITLLIIASLNCAGQLVNISTSIRTGWAFTTNELVLSPELNFEAHGFALSPAMIIHIKRDQPANFGLKISYTYKFIEVGYGKYYDLYSMDKYDSYRNGWSDLYFVALHAKVNSEVLPNDWFIEEDYDKQFILNIGFKLPL
jgi:hypothetical protein